MTAPYAHAPLVLVAAEIKFPELPLSRLKASIEQLKDAFRPILPLFDLVTHTKVEFVAGLGQGGARQEIQSFPRFKTRDSTTALAIQSSTLVLETTQYSGYENFRPIIERVVQGVGDVLSPDGLTRVGLRYIDEVRVSKIRNHPGDWTSYIDPHLLAAVNEGFLPEGLKPHSWIGQVQYKTGDASMLTLHYGPMDGYAVNPNSDGARRRNAHRPGPFFLLDSDSAWTADDVVPEFSTQGAMEIFDDLHRPVSAIFNAACTQLLRDSVFNRGAMRTKKQS